MCLPGRHTRASTTPSTVWSNSRKNLSLSDTSLKSYWESRGETEAQSGVLQDEVSKAQLCVSFLPNTRGPQWPSQAAPTLGLQVIQALQSGAMPGSYAFPMKPLKGLSNLQRSLEADDAHTISEKTSGLGLGRVNVLEVDQGSGPANTPRPRPPLPF